MKRWQIGLGALLAVAGIVAWKAEPLAMAWFSATTTKTTLDERIDLIAEGIEIHVPEGAGPFPVVLQFHGCAGIRPPFHAQWEKVDNDAG